MVGIEQSIGFVHPQLFTQYENNNSYILLFTPIRGGFMWGRGKALYHIHLLSHIYKLDKFSWDLKYIHIATLRQISVICHLIV